LYIILGDISKSSIYSWYLLGTSKKNKNKDRHILVPVFFNITTNILDRDKYDSYYVIR
jgi:hypothetical protein